MLLTIHSPAHVDMAIKEPETIFDSEEWQNLESELDELNHDMDWYYDRDMHEQLDEWFDETTEQMKTLLNIRLQEIENMHTYNAAILDEKAAILRKLDELA